MHLGRSDEQALCPIGKERAPMKSFAIAAGAVLALAFSAGSAMAADGGATVEYLSVSFAPLNSDTCQYLPEGTSITWSGIEKSITRTRTSAAGITTVSNTSHASGFATDQDGNRYAFNYSNGFRLSNSADDPGVFNGTMTDSFSLAGQGPARLHNGFQASLSTDLATFFTFSNVHSRGDPIDFATVTAHCDPL
jgi:hypothetical protein